MAYGQWSNYGGPEGAWPPWKSGRPLETCDLRGYKGPLKGPLEITCQTKFNAWLQRIILSTDVDAPSTRINWSTMLILADRTNGRDIATVLCLSVICLWRNVCIVATCQFYRKTVWKSKHEMAYGESNGHVADNVTWPWKVNVMTPICLGPISSTAAADTDLVTMTTTLRGRGHDSNMLRAESLKYLENSWRCYLATIANYSIVCYETVLSAILAWLLVC